MAIVGNLEVKAVIILGLALLSCVVNGSRRDLVEATAPVFDVTQFGAKADDKTDNFGAFIKAWNAGCHSGGPAKVVIPAGKYLAGPLVFQGPCNSSMELEIQGTIKATTDLSEYTSPEWISFEFIDGLTITGGVLDGQGSAVWQYNDCRQNKKCQPLPANVKFFTVNNTVINGVTSLNSKYFHFHIFHSNNITIDNVNITAPGDSPNTDGVHLSLVNRVTVSNSVISTGDDCVSIGQGSLDVTISNITCGPGHGLSVGSLGKYKEEKDVGGILVKNCRLFNTTNGARIKTWTNSIPGQAVNITFQDIIMDNVKNPVIIDQLYGNPKAPASRWKLSDIHFRNIKGTSISATAVSLTCSEFVPCERVELVDIDLVYVGQRKDKPFVSECLNAKATFAGKQNPPACKLQ